MTGDPIASSQVVEGGACHHGPALDVVALLQAREDEAHHDAPEHQHHHQDQAPVGKGNTIWQTTQSNKGYSFASTICVSVKPPKYIAAICILRGLLVLRWTPSATSLCTNH